MTTTSTAFPPADGAQLTAEAFDHLIFPLIPVADVKESGPRVYVEGEGVRLTDVNGKTYLDMMSSHTRANALGYGNEEIAAAVYEQLRKLHYVGTVSNLRRTDDSTRDQGGRAGARRSRTDSLRQRRLGGGRSRRSRLAKQYQMASGNKPRAYKIISRWNAYHGATMGALGGDRLARHPSHRRAGRAGLFVHSRPENYRNPFDMADEQYAEFCATYLEQQILHEGPDYVAAFIAETVMQANGVQIAAAQLFPARPRDLRQIRRALDQRRGHHRVRPDRQLVRDRASRRRAGHHDLRESAHRRLHADGRGDRETGDRRRACRSSATSTPSAATPARRPRPTR